MNTAALHAWVAVRSFAVVARARLGDEAGEGVISTAIAILIIAVVGVAMLGLLNGLTEDAADKAGEQIEQIGNG